MPTTTIPLARSAQEQLLPAGVYAGKIEEVEVVEESPSGFPYLKLRLHAVIAGERKAFWTNVSLAPTARFKVDELLDALEAPAEGELSISQLKGASIFFKLGVTTYNGEQRNSIEKFLTPTQVRDTQVLNRSGIQAQTQARPGTTRRSPAAQLPSTPAAAASRRPMRVAEMREVEEEGEDDEDSGN